MTEQEQINVGDTVAFIDEFGIEQTSTVTRIVPKGEYSEYEEAYAIAGTYGSYVRTRDEIIKK
jgi:hypothetical protein